MRKLVALLLTFVMILAVSVSMTACKTNKNDDKGSETLEQKDETKETEQTTIIGTWEGMVDYSEAFAQMNINEEMREYITIDGCKFKLIYTFTEGGIVELTLDKDSYIGAVKDMIDDMEEGLIMYATTMIKKESSDKTVDEYFKDKLGISLEELLDTSYNSFVSSVDSMDFSESHEYHLDGNKLYMFGDTDYYVIVELSGNKLEFVELSTDDVGVGIKPFYEGVTFERQ